eukprot:UN33937
MDKERTCLFPDNTDSEKEETKIVRLDDSPLQGSLAFINDKNDESTWEEKLRCIDDLINSFQHFLENTDIKKLKPDVLKEIQKALYYLNEAKTVHSDRQTAFEAYRAQNKISKDISKQISQTPSLKRLWDIWLDNKQTFASSCYTDIFRRLEKFKTHSIIFPQDLILDSNLPSFITASIESPVRYKDHEVKNISESLVVLDIQLRHIEKLITR